jgi:hypothetical protein
MIVMVRYVMKKHKEFASTRAKSGTTVWMHHKTALDGLEKRFLLAGGEYVAATPQTRRYGPFRAVWCRLQPG